jgi:hypothetical protein
MDDFEECVNAKSVMATIKYRNEKDKIKSRKVKCYYNNFLGAEIINAQTGESMEGRVGSINENLFYKVKHCGFIDKPVTLYYYTKGEFEKHLNV